MLMSEQPIEANSHTPPACTENVIIETDFHLYDKERLLQHIVNSSSQRRTIVSKVYPDVLSNSTVSWLKETSSKLNSMNPNQRKLELQSISHAMGEYSYFIPKIRKEYSKITSSRAFVLRES